MEPLWSVIVDEHAVSRGSRPTVGRGLGIFPAAVLLAGLLLVGVAPVVSSVAAICIGPSCTPSGDWTQFHNSVTRVGYNAVENQLGPSNVAALGVAWHAEPQERAGLWKSVELPGSVGYAWQGRCRYQHRRVARTSWIPRR